MDLLRQFQSKHGENKATTVLQVSEHTEGTEADIQDTESSEITSTDIPETPPPLVAAPTVPVSRKASVYSEPDQGEKELDALIDQLRPLKEFCGAWYPDYAVGSNGTGHAWEGVVKTHRTLAFAYFSRQAP